MQHLLFLAVIAGALLVVDDLHFQGRYRSEIWQQATYAGRSFSREVDYRIGRALR